MTVCPAGSVSLRCDINGVAETGIGLVEELGEESRGVFGPVVELVPVELSRPTSSENRLSLPAVSSTICRSSFSNT